MIFQTLVIALLTVGTAAHMQLMEPLPLGHGDPEMVYPYNCCGNTNPEPCRGFLNLLGTAQGKSQATWAAGSRQVWKSGGISPLTSTHYGGSCQISLSFDKGKTFRVITSYEGNCPHRKGGTDTASQTFPFTVPADTPSGEAVFGWSWFNREQEFFHTCAVVTITGGNGAPVPPDPSEDPQPNPSIEPTNGLPISSGPIKKPPPSVKLPTASVAPVPGPSEGGGYSESKTKSKTHTKTSTTKTTSHSRAWGRPKPDPTPCDSTSKIPHRRDLPQTINATSTYEARFDALNHTLINRQAAAVPFNQRPLMFLANWKQKTKCYTPWQSQEAKFPQPGPDVVKGDGEYPLGLPDCTTGIGYREANGQAG